MDQIMQWLIGARLAAGWVGAASPAQRTDWLGHVGGEVAAVVHPEETAEVAAVLRAASDTGTLVQVQGGNTGLVGGGIPPDPLAGSGSPGIRVDRNVRGAGVGDQSPVGAAADPSGGPPILLCTDQLVGISNADPITGQLTAGAGTSLADVQRAAEAMGWVYGVDLAARDSATIGGTVATNAGGIRVCAYGSTRAQLLGVEAVTADGSVISDLAGLSKDNTGYDLAGLLCGSEGTLAVVTKVRVRLHRPPPPSTVAVTMVADLREAAGLAADAARPGVGLLAAEVVDADSWRGAARDADAIDPLAGAQGDYVLLVEVGDGGDASGFSDAIAGRDRAAVAVDPTEERALWRLREGQTEYWVARGGELHKFDVSLPVAGLDPCVAELRAYAADHGGTVGVFGHIREGNLHLQLRLPAGREGRTAAESSPGSVSHSTPEDRAGYGGGVFPLEIEGHAEALADPAVVILPMVARLGGSISAEHGIGRAKAPYLYLRRSPGEIALMRSIKHAWDPHGILNPGVILPRHLPRDP